MKISELIDELEKFEKEHGDIEVVTRDMGGLRCPVECFYYEENPYWDEARDFDGYIDTIAR